MIFFHLGRYVLLLKSAFSRPERFSLYWKEIIREMVSIGVGSLGIIIIVSIFMGAVTTVQTAYQLVSGLVPLEIIGQITRDGTLLELCPTISMLVLAGKIGSNIASEIGTMRVTEQIDALEIMGINSSGYLILPKIVAGFFMIPALIIIGMSFSIFGGYLAGTLSGVISPQQFIDGVMQNFDPYILRVGMVKTFVFSFIITSVSAYHGFYTDGGALEVGKSSTKAVVYSCVLILFADYLVAQLLF